MPVVITFTVIGQRRRSDVVNQDNRYSKDGSDDVTGGAQEVPSIEGPVLSLGLEVVNLGQEFVDS